MANGRGSATKPSPGAWGPDLPRRSIRRSGRVPEFRGRSAPESQDQDTPAAPGNADPREVSPHRGNRSSTKVAVLAAHELFGPKGRPRGSLEFRRTEWWTHGPPPRSGAVTADSRPPRLGQDQVRPSNGKRGHRRDRACRSPSTCRSLATARPRGVAHPPAKPRETASTAELAGGGGAVDRARRPRPADWCSASTLGASRPRMVTCD